MRSGGCQHSLLCLNWKGSDHIYSMPANSLSVSVFLCLLFPQLSHTQKASEARGSVCAHVRTHSHAQRSNVGHWFESVFVILILCFFTSPSPGPSPLLSLLLLLQSGRLGGARKSENKGVPSGKRAKKERLKNERQSKREERRSAFSLNTRP